LSGKVIQVEGFGHVSVGPQMTDGVGVAVFARIAGEPLTKGAKKRQTRAAGYAYEPVLSVLEELGAEMFVRPNERSCT
ncbi:MAG: hypothetical protein QF735_13190, partial [Phycisphaeraceae bacterium]|nr:hypothetical protein [Phycisphaeraceae bacterium]